jgi:hypothetical protein
MSKWMDSFLVDRHVEVNQKEANGALLGLATASTSGMTSRLITQLTEDLDQYCAATGDRSITTSATLTTMRIVRDGGFPSFDFRLDKDDGQQPMIHCTKKSQSNSGAEAASVLLRYPDCGKGSG